MRSAKSARRSAFARRSTGASVPQCCGSEREVTLDCPSSCVYLQQARANEKPRTLEEIAATGVELFPTVNVTPQFSYEREPLLAGLSFGVVKMARAASDQPSAETAANAPGKPPRIFSAGGGSPITPVEEM